MKKRRRSGRIKGEDRKSLLSFDLLSFRFYDMIDRIVFSALERNQETMVGEMKPCPAALLMSSRPAKQLCQKDAG